MKSVLLVCVLCAIFLQVPAQRETMNFNNDWKFILDDSSSYSKENWDDDSWRTLSLPHDWSIEGKFDSTHPTGNSGGALPGGIGWYRKTFKLPSAAKNKNVFIQFDGVYENSEVWINGHYLGKRPYGYVAFEYELTPYVKPGVTNVVAVRVNNSQQPNSRWYSGSGIYRDVKLIVKNKAAIRQWGVFITTPKITKEQATIQVNVNLLKITSSVKLHHKILNKDGKLVAQQTLFSKTEAKDFTQSLQLSNPKLWSVKNPYLYKMVTDVYVNNRLIDRDTAVFGVRYFNFDVSKGFSLNGEPMKILGVCMHHDLGALGAAFNPSAARRQLQILKEMGCNAIRIAHNPPAAAFLDLCDEMGFLVMDEAFDMWAKKKNKFDYHLYFNEWHKKDLEAMVLRDRNHPSVFMWSIGNEIREQFDSTGITIGQELVNIVKTIDPSRPVTCALSENNPQKNYIYQSKALDVVGLNYHIEAYEDFPKNYPGEKFIATENVSGLASRGHYDMPADSLRLWPPSSKFKYVPDGNPDYSVSAYDNVAAYWGSTHEQTWRIIKKHDYLSGLFVWSGFDFLGEPVPYPYPARSSYYGIVDLAGFPKDVYYMYQSEWTNKPVLHIATHWNLPAGQAGWKAGQNVDVKIYYNNADEVELFLNGKSLGSKAKSDTVFHVLWTVPYEPGELKAVSRLNGKIVLQQLVKTAGAPAKIELITDRSSINKDNNELAFVTIRVLDANGNLVPDAENLIQIQTSSNAKVVCMDNGFPADLNSMRDAQHRVYKGMGIAIIKGVHLGNTTITATATGLTKAAVSLLVK
ncbi:MAG: sugar-binding domain-containing protein [Niabella sp.]